MNNSNSLKKIVFWYTHKEMFKKSCQLFKILKYLIKYIITWPIVREQIVIKFENFIYEKVARQQTFMI